MDQEEGPGGGRFADGDTGSPAAARRFAGEEADRLKIEAEAAARFADGVDEYVRQMVSDIKKKRARSRSEPGTTPGGSTR